MTQSLNPTRGERSDELTALLLPLQGGLQLLIPNITMAELAPGDTPTNEGSTGLDWLAGQILWRGRTTPVVRWEGLTGHPIEADSEDHRFAVMNRLYDDLDSAFYALLIQGIPRMLRIGPESLNAAADSAEERLPGTLFTVDTEMGQAHIPDIAWLEQQLAGILRQ